MPRPAQDLEKRLINLRTGDFDKLKEYYPKFYPSGIIRELVAQFVDAHEQGRVPAIQFDPNKLKL
jgi:hypothetical protein